MSNKKKLELKNVQKKIIDDENIVFVGDLIAELGVSRSSFYEYYPAESDNMDNIVDLLDRNKVSKKRRLRTRWEFSDNATLSKSLYLLLADEDERDALNNNKTFVINAEQAPQLEMLDNAYNEED